MAGYRIEPIGRPADRTDGESTPQARVLRATSCYEVMAISEDFQDLIREACPRCQGGAGLCLSRQMRDFAGEPNGD